MKTRDELWHILNELVFNEVAEGILEEEYGEQILDKGELADSPEEMAELIYVNFGKEF